MPSNNFSISSPPHQELQNSNDQEYAYMEGQNLHHQEEIYDHDESISIEEIQSLSDDFGESQMEEEYPHDEFDVLENDCSNHNPQDQMFDDSSEDDYTYTGEYYPGYGQDLSLTKSFSYSKSQYYTCCSDQKIDFQIRNEIKVIMELTFLPFQWAFQLYSSCHWQMDQIHTLLDHSKSFEQVILYKKNYQPKQERQINFCEVCCEKSRLIANTCGHAFCLNCWTQLLKVTVSEKSDLFPQCQKADCHQKMNFKLSCIVLEKSENSQLKKQFNRVKIIQYSRYNNSVKICPDSKCEKKFFIDYLSCLPIICQCGMYICAYCGKQHHYPITCPQKQIWQRMREDQNFKNLLLESVKYKICPSCDELIEKNGGCNIMTCKCSHQFCWICLQDLRTHELCSGWNIYPQIEDQKSQNVPYEINYQKSFEQEEFERYCKFEERISSYNYDELMRGLLKIEIPLERMHIIKNSKDYLLAALRFCKSVIIYSFFRGEKQIHPIHRKIIYLQLDQIDDYLTKIQKLYQKFSQSIHEDTQEKYRKQLEGMLLEDERERIANILSRAQELLMKIFESE